MKKYFLLLTLGMTGLIACGDDGGPGGGGDTTPPAAIGDLAAPDADASSIFLEWTAPGDDANTGRASSYLLKYSTTPITGANFSAATTIPGLPAPGVAGFAESFEAPGIDTSDVYYFAMKTRDDAGNLSPVSNIAQWTPRGVPVHLRIDLAPVRDNSIFEEADTSSNGAGAFMYAGNTQLDNARRALLEFDIAGNIPAAATIDSVLLTMHVSRTAPNSNDRDFALHVLLQDWGEAGSDAGDPGGFGADAQPGDATWAWRFYKTTAWATPGGQFLGASATTAVPEDDDNFVTWKSVTLTADVRSWLVTPAANHGWILLGEETDSGTARRFDSRENPTAANRPKLTVWYTVLN